LRAKIPVQEISYLCTCSSRSSDKWDCGPCSCSLQ